MNNIHKLLGSKHRVQVNLETSQFSLQKQSIDIKAESLSECRETKGLLSRYIELFSNIENIAKNNRDINIKDITKMKKLIKKVSSLNLMIECRKSKGTHHYFSQFENRLYKNADIHFYYNKAEYVLAVVFGTKKSYTAVTDFLRSIESEMSESTFEEIESIKDHIQEKIISLSTLSSDVKSKFNYNERGFILDQILLITEENILKLSTFKESL